MTSFLFPSYQPPTQTRQPTLVDLLSGMSRQAVPQPAPPPTAPVPPPPPVMPPLAATTPVASEPALKPVGAAPPPPIAVPPRQPDVNIADIISGAGTTPTPDTPAGPTLADILTKLFAQPAPPPGYGGAGQAPPPPPTGVAPGNVAQPSLADIINAGRVSSPPAPGGGAGQMQPGYQNMAALNRAPQQTASGLFQPIGIGQAAPVSLPGGGFPSGSLPSITQAVQSILDRNRGQTGANAGAAAGAVTGDQNIGAINAQNAANLAAGQTGENLAGKTGISTIDIAVEAARKKAAEGK